MKKNIISVLLLTTFSILFLLPVSFAESKDNKACILDSDCSLDASCLGCNKCFSSSPVADLGIDCLAVCDKDYTASCECVDQQCAKRTKDKNSLLQLLNEADESVRFQAVTALGNLNDVSIAETIALSLYDPSPMVQFGAASALGKLKDKRGLDFLISALKLGAPNRTQAANFLGEIKEPSAVDPLIDVIKNKDEDIWMKWFSIKALGQIKDPKAVEPMIALLSDPDSRIKAQAAESLSAITGESFGSEISKWQEWFDQNKK